MMENLRQNFQNTDIFRHIIPQEWRRKAITCVPLNTKKCWMGNEGL